MIHRRLLTQIKRKSKSRWKDKNCTQPNTHKPAPPSPLPIKSPRREGDRRRRSQALQSISWLPDCFLPSSSSPLCHRLSSSLFSPLLITFHYFFLLSRFPPDPIRHILFFVSLTSHFHSSSSFSLTLLSFYLSFFAFFPFLLLHLLSNSSLYVLSVTCSFSSSPLPFLFLFPDESHLHTLQYALRVAL